MILKKDTKGMSRRKMAPSLKSASVIFLLTIPSLVIAASPTCTLKDSAPAGSTCGTYGDVTNFDYFIEDLYDPQYTSILSCASECGNRTNCKSFNLRTEKEAFCELHSGTQQKAGFVSEDEANRTTSSYQGFDLDCFDCVDDASNQRLAVNESSSSSTSTSSESQSQTPNQVTASIGLSTQGTASSTPSSSASRYVSSSSTSGFGSSPSTSDPQPSTLMFIAQAITSSASVTNSSTTSVLRTTLVSVFSSSTSGSVPPPNSATYTPENSSFTGNSTVGTAQSTLASASSHSNLLRSPLTRPQGSCWSLRPLIT